MRLHFFSRNHDNVRPWNKLYWDSFSWNLLAVEILCLLEISQPQQCKTQQERQFFSLALQFATPQTTFKYLARCSWVVMYTVVSPLKLPGPECAISSFSEYTRCAKTSFHLRMSKWPSGNVQQSWLCRSGFESDWFHNIGLNFYNSEWHERAGFLHIPKDTRATAHGHWPAKSSMGASLLPLYLRVI